MSSFHDELQEGLHGRRLQASYLECEREFSGSAGATHSGGPDASHRASVLCRCQRLTPNRIVPAFRGEAVILSFQDTDADKSRPIQSELR